MLEALLYIRLGMETGIWREKDLPYYYKKNHSKIAPDKLTL